MKTCSGVGTTGSFVLIIGTS